MRSPIQDALRNHVRPIMAAMAILLLYVVGYAVLRCTHVLVHRHDRSAGHRVDLYVFSPDVSMMVSEPSLFAKPRDIMNRALLLVYHPMRKAEAIYYDQFHACK